MALQTKTKTKLKPLVKKEIEGSFIINLFDNYKRRVGLKSGWGFSCFIKRKDSSNILFDTGASGEDLLFNMKEMKVNPEEVDIIFLSHIHSDHTGGLFDFLNRNSNIKVILPASFSEDFKNRIKGKEIEVEEIKDFKKVGEKLFSTGEFNYTTKEQSLIIETKKGLVVITGCAHPGILNILNQVEKNLDREIHLVLGGFHLQEASQNNLEKIIKEFKKKGIKKVAPSHCSGDRTLRLFEKEYKNNYIKNGVGKIINL